MLIIQGVSYYHPNRDILFEELSLTVNAGDKIALIGNNGSGKSTLLRLLAGQILPSKGLIRTQSVPFYLPQHFGQFNDITVASALGANDKLGALRKILNGDLSEENILALNDDWTIEDRCLQALKHWQLEGVNLDQQLGTLSGGQKSRVFLAAIDVTEPGIILMDEPSNHLDKKGRELLYRFIGDDPRTFIIVSHDRSLLNQLDFICELTSNGLRSYGGNYDFYLEQKLLEKNALEQDLRSAEKAVRKAKITSRDTMERQQKLDARGKKKQEKAGVPTIMMNTLRNSAEKTGSKLKDAHEEKVGALSGQLTDLRNKIADVDQMKLGFDNSGLHRGKVLFKATDINARYDEKLLWKNPVQLEMLSGDRIALTGSNGSGKTTLIKIILGELEASEGSVWRASFQSVYIDQDYSLIDNSLTVYQQTGRFNKDHLMEHELKIRLNRFLFSMADWDKQCGMLSGGEKMRLALCCLAIANKAPDLIILDEPTNNLDIQNVEILGAAIKDYHGTLVVVSHDDYFLKETGVIQSLDLDTAVFHRYS